MQQGYDDRAAAADFRAYIDVLRRRWISIAVFVAVFLGLATAYSFTRSPIYTARAEVLVQPPTSSTVFRPDQLVSLDTEARIVSSAPIALTAKKQLGLDLTIPKLLEHLSVEATPDTLILDVSFWAANARDAANGANAFADAYLTFKQAQAMATINSQRGAIQDTLTQLGRQRDQQNRILEASAPGSVEFRNAQAERDTLNGQITLLTAQLSQIPVTVDPGQVILPATAPLGPSSPKHVVDLVLGAFLGLFFGIVFAFVLDRLDDRIRSAKDLEESVDAPVVGSSPVSRVGVVTTKGG